MLLSPSAPVAGVDEPGALPARFDAALRALGPFETRPRLAVAVSGGADSLALCRLAAQWAAARGGEAIALTVDHGLRPGSADEAAQVARLLACSGIVHATLTWRGPKPATGLQAAARAARYALLSDWCRRAGVLHLLLGHHRHDQLETVVMRSRRRRAGAGAPWPHADPGMAAVVATPAVRLLRPLLAIDPAALRSWLRAVGQPWLEDPSNADRRFERVRVREELAQLGPHDREALFRAAAAAQRAAAARSARIADVLAAGCRLDAAGVACLAPAALADGDPAVAMAALGRVLTTVGGRSEGPDRGALARLHAALVDGTATAATLHRCRLRRVGEVLEVSRELRHLPPPVDAVAGAVLHWDGRFRIAVGAAVPRGHRIAALATVSNKQGAGAVPALVDANGKVLPPIFALGADVFETGIVVNFQPIRALSGMGRFVAVRNCATMSPLEPALDPVAG